MEIVAEVTLTLVSGVVLVVLWRGTVGMLLFTLKRAQDNEVDMKVRIIGGNQN